MIDELLSMGFETYNIVFYLPKVFNKAIKYNHAIYDISYVVLAEQEKIDFVTGDERLFNTLKEDLKFVYHIATFLDK